jgi:hypothetical protein
MDQLDDADGWDNDPPDYRAPDEISPDEMRTALGSLCTLGGDPYLATQITGIKDYEFLVQTSEAMSGLAATRIMLNRIAAA